jgi:hypothetical protein
MIQWNVKKDVKHPMNQIPLTLFTIFFCRKIKKKTPIKDMNIAKDIE